MQRRKVMNKINLLILFGGKSNEHDVSRLSTNSILTNINREKYNKIITVGITKNGDWFLTNATAEQIKDNSWLNLKDNQQVTVNVSNSSPGLLTKTGEIINIDCVMLMMHGKHAEDGTMQGLWDICGIPYTGPEVLASATAMDKLTSKLIVNNIDVKQAKYAHTNKFNYHKQQDKEIEKVLNCFNHQFPLFVKPSNSGSSLGVSRVIDKTELIAAIEAALEIDSKVLIEEEIIGREIEVAILGNKEAKASRIGEIFSSNTAIYDYQSKYFDNKSMTRIVKDLSEEEEERIRQTALEVYNAFDCRGLSRVDFFYTAQKELYFNEINTLPGFTEISMYPKLWQDMGINYAQLIDEIVEFTMNK